MPSWDYSGKNRHAYLNKGEGVMKVGDRVEFLPYRKVNDNRNVGFPREMEKVIGQEGVVMNEIGEDYWAVKDNNGYEFTWHKTWLKKEEPMWDEETIQAIKDSHNHHDVDNRRRLLNGETLDLTPKSCDLCQKFNPNEDGSCVTTCPLALKNMYCGKPDSPYKKLWDNPTIENLDNMVLALKSLFYPEEPKKKEVFYHVGQRFSNKGEAYILCIHDAKSEYDIVQMTCLKDGYRGGKPITVKNSDKITEKEFKEICAVHNFTLKEEDSK